jgi:hypothetical protein
MNNNYEDQGQRNAKTLSKLLKGSAARDLRATGLTTDDEGRVAQAENDQFSRASSAAALDGLKVGVAA